MRPLFTIHAGEYLVGSHIEEHNPRWSVWIPSKDTGIDLLVTGVGNKNAVSLQVKFSKDFNPDYQSISLQKKVLDEGWWAYEERKLKESPADFWVFVLPSLSEHKTSFIIIPPSELLRRLRSIHGRPNKKIQSYFCVTKNGHCWESRGLSNDEHEDIASDHFTDDRRDFSRFLNNWSQIEKRLKK